MHDKIVLVDKPVGFSSFQIVRMFQKFFKKVGHAGTLDPFASGLLIILIGRATKRFDEFQSCEKEYEGEILLGAVNNTYDISGRPIKYIQKVDFSSSDELRKTAEEFEGEVYQTPPPYSALKIKGRKMYELSRKGIEVRPKKRKVFIKKFSIIDYEDPRVKFNTVVGKGVYIRTLAFDFGERLGCGAFLLSLRRIRIGDFKVTDAVKVGDLFQNEFFKKRKN